MTGTEFDLVIRAIGIDSRSRRQVIRTFSRSAVGAIGAFFGIGQLGWQPGAAIAAGNETCQAAQPAEFISKQSCVEFACGTTSGCLCVQTVGHIPTCVVDYDPTKQRDCPKKNQCGERRPCKNGFVCAKVEGCCGSSNHKCLRRCPA